MNSLSEYWNDFLGLSVAITGYPVFRLQGTGQAALYFATVRKIIGDADFLQLLTIYRRVAELAKGDEALLDKELRAEIFSHPKMGPIARNIIKLWYIGIWYQLPESWRQAYGVLKEDVTFVVSPQTYPQGLAWPTFGSTPLGAKEPGFGTWSEPPIFVEE